MKFFEAVDEKGENCLILRDKGRFLIFYKGSTLLKYLINNKAGFFQKRKAIKMIRNIISKHEDKLIMRRIYKLETDKVSYIG